MKNSATIEIHNPAAVRKAGLTALTNELGRAGAAYFLRQYSEGRGDYTAERSKLREGISFDDIVKSVRELDNKKD